MVGIELLEKYPLASIVIKDYLMEVMLESFKDENIPEEFKEMMRKEGVENDKVAALIDANPRFLYDVFDNNEIVVETHLYPNNEFTIKIGNQATTNSWKTRKEADAFAVESAFELLENKLTPVREE